MRIRVYIAGPITKGDLAGNIQRASDAFEVLSLAGFAPMCPHWSCFSGKVQVSPAGGTVYAVAGANPNKLTHADWLAVDLPWVEVAHAVLRLDGESTGADMEVRHANGCKIPVFYSVAELLDWRAAGNFGAA